ncbi:MAG: transketolase [Candidatus Fermentibacteraceae bacterium]
MRSGFGALGGKCRELRRMILGMIHEARSGHPGGSLSCVEILVLLYHGLMQHDPENPGWAGRDRFVLSKGHAAPALYAVLADCGYFPVEELSTLRRFGSRLQGHPHMQSLPGLDCSTGSLGQGLSIASGMALGLRLMGSSARVYCLLGDGELQEGSVWEAVMSAPALALSNLTAIVDNNGVQLDGRTCEIIPVEPLVEKWKAFGWNVRRCPGHDLDAMKEALAEIQVGPSVLIADTVKGRGVSFMEGDCSWHGRAPDDSELADALAELGSC